MVLGDFCEFNDISTEIIYECYRAFWFYLSSVCIRVNSCNIETYNEFIDFDQEYKVCFESLKNFERLLQKYTSFKYSSYVLLINI